MKLPKLKCTRCSHSWIPRQEKPPKVCSKCNSPYWNKKRVQLKQISPLSHIRKGKKIKEIKRNMDKAIEIIQPFRKGKVKIDPKFFKELKYEVKIPTITCWCGKEILDTPSNRLRVKMGKSCFRKGKKIK